jgi:hypothetical protein
MFTTLSGLECTYNCAESRIQKGQCDEENIKKEQRWRKGRKGEEEEEEDVEEEERRKGYGRNNLFMSSTDLCVS